jgi:hypothetical protein
LTENAYTWFQGIKANVLGMPHLKQLFLTRFNKWGVTAKEFQDAWIRLKYDYVKPVEDFFDDIQELATLLDFNENNVFTKFRQGFPTQIQIMLRGVQTKDALIAEARELVGIIPSEERNISTPTNTALHHKVETNYAQRPPQYAENRGFMPDKIPPEDRPRHPPAKHYNPPKAANPPPTPAPRSGGNPRYKRQRQNPNPRPPPPDVRGASSAEPQNDPSFHCLFCNKQGHETLKCWSMERTLLKVKDTYAQIGIDIPLPNLGDLNVNCHEYDDSF